jgi:hypothetical protein
MDSVQNSSSSECYAPSSEPSRLIEIRLLCWTYSPKFLLEAEKIPGPNAAGKIR